MTPVDSDKGCKGGARQCYSQRSYGNLLKWAGAVFPRKAYSRVLVVRTASENLVLETQQLPLLETLLENIECWPVVLVAAGGLLIPMYAGSGDREARLTPLASTVLSRARGLKRRPLAPHPHPRSAQEFKPARWLRLDQRFESLRSNYKPVSKPRDFWPCGSAKRGSLMFSAGGPDSRSVRTVADRRLLQLS